MVEQAAVLQAVRACARISVQDREVGDLLWEVGDQIAAALGVAGVGIALARPDSEARFVIATNEATSALESTQDRLRLGPCYDAYQTGTPVLVPDLGASRRWPAFASEADNLGVAAVAAVPIHLRERPVGSLGLFHARPHEWSDDETAAAALFADMACAYVWNNVRLIEAQQLAGQLQAALESRVLVEQAKGYLAARRDIETDAAFEVLREYSRNHNLKLRVVAKDVVEGLLDP